MTPHTPLADAISTLKKMHKRALNQGWEASARAIAKTIDAVTTTTF